MFKLVGTRLSTKATQNIWDAGLKDTFRTLFTELSFVDNNSGIRALPVARFISALYETKVLRRDEWPTSRIVEEMHLRGYAADVFTKASYGAEPPPPLSIDECLKWVAYFRLVTLNRT